MKPSISVIIPAHNSADTIGEAIISMATQTLPPLEILVIDDHSTDSTKAVVEKVAREYPSVSYHALQWDDPKRFSKTGRNINAGYLARNYGFTLVKGEWITFQDADDVSLRNRLEAQYALAEKYNATHVCVDWQKYDPAIVNMYLDVDAIMASEKEPVVDKEVIYVLSQKTKGWIVPFIGPANRLVPFEWKQARFINKLFMRSLEAYPGTGNSPLFKKEVLEKVQFRPLSRRIWPSFVGRGADRDFNFQVAETFRNSYVFRLPLYLWRVPNENERYLPYRKYLKM